MSRVPVFIIVHDRVAVLRKTVAALARISTPIDVVFHDVASSFPGCLAYLREAEARGHTVYRSKFNHPLTVIESMLDYLGKHPETTHVVLTDPDVELDNVNDDILEFYRHLYDKYRLVVGPVLRTDDIPDCFPKKAAILALNKPYIDCETDLVRWKGAEYKIARYPIDTTFQLFGRDAIERPFPRQSAIRCYAPYAARHLDWYLDPANLTPDQEYYSKHASAVSHCGRDVRSPKIITGHDWVHVGAKKAVQTAE